MNEYNDILLVDDIFSPGLTVKEAQALKPIQKKFMTSYLAQRDKLTVEEWLRTEISTNLPERTPEELEAMSNELIATLKLQEQKRNELEQAIKSGRSKESWFAAEAKRATSLMSAQDASMYMHNLDEALANANDSLSRTIHTQSGSLNMNPHLDGFIAEQYHAQTFNLKAEATGSPYRAKVLEPDGTSYGKNSVDIVIVDGKDKIVRRYQSKYCKDAEATARAFELGDYRGQQKLVPDGQELDITKKTSTVIEAPDGTKSTPLSKSQAQRMQSEAQSGNWNELNWNEYHAKDLAIGIGKQAGQAALMGAAVGVGFDIASKVWHGEKIDGEELVETAITTGADFGVKAAAAGALKVGVEKGFIKAIPKGTPAGTIANIVHVAAENVKVIGKMVKGELTAKEGLEKMEQVTVSTVAGIASSTKGTMVGAAIGSVLGPVGTAVGGFIGGTIGYMAGSKVGETFVKGVQKIRDKVCEAVSNVANKVKDIGSSFKNFLRGLFA